MKKLSVKSVVAIGIGAALFFVLGKISIPTPVPNTYISLQYAVQAVFAMLFGPIAGLLIGLVGIRSSMRRIMAHGGAGSLLPGWQA